jgi:ADP-heptose:LPS heptosyltransferase
MHTWLRWRLRMLLRRCARLLPSQTLSAPPRRILCLIAGGLGDRFMALPALRACRTRYPDAYIQVCLLDGGLPGIEAHLGRVYTAGTPRRRVTVMRLCLQRWDMVYVNATGIYRVWVEWYTLLSRAPLRIGPCTRDIDPTPLYTRCFRVDDALHLTAINMRGMCPSPQQSQYPYPLHTPPRRNDTLPERPRLGIHPGSDRRYTYKRWPFSRFCGLAERCVSDLAADVCMLFGAHEYALYTRARNEQQAFSCVYIPDLDTLVDTVSGLDVLVANDTGYAHAAAALDVTLVVLFGPTDPRICAPVFTPGRGEIVTPDHTCTGCHTRQGGCSTRDCMQAISLAQVVHAVQRCMNASC